MNLNFLAARLGVLVQRLRSTPRSQENAVALVPDISRVDFQCNICGRENRDVPLLHAENREYPSCAHCHASLRMRSLMLVLSRALFDKDLILPEFPVDKMLRGLGMSDWENYAKPLSKKFAYTNTFYHGEPHLDIADVPDALCNQNDFIISSDVFEHIPPALLGRAFANAWRLLRPGGVFLFTVPFAKEGETTEHFPRLHNFRIIETRGKRFLYNRTIDGEEEIFDELVFHGGEGMTLEMRHFSEPDLRRHLVAAGFRDITIHFQHFSRFGILWPMDWAVPITARR